MCFKSEMDHRGWYVYDWTTDFTAHIHSSLFSVHGKIKQWRYFEQVIQNSSIPSVGMCLNMICALIDTYGKRNQIDTAMGRQWNPKMEVLLAQGNQLLPRAWNACRKITRNLNGKDTMRRWSSFQRCLSRMWETSVSVSGIFRKFIVHHEMQFIVELCAAHPDLIPALFASRHSSYNNYIATVQLNNDDDDDDDPIKRWFCTCSAGARAIDGCAHVTAVIWHLGVSTAALTNSEHRLSVSRFIQFVKDCIHPYHSNKSDDT